MSAVKQAYRLSTAEYNAVLRELEHNRRRARFEQKLGAVHTTRRNDSNKQRAAKYPGKGQRRNWRAEI
jgi:hypothetical protein